MSSGVESLAGARGRARRPSLSRAPADVVRALGWLEREAFPATIAALYGIALLLVMPGELVQDSWATLVAGREIVRHGLPHRETLTVMAHGARWVDQQWLAQVVFYDLFKVGGYRLILLAHVVLIASAFGVAIVAARWRGASPQTVSLVALLCFFVAPWGWQLRAQSFGPLLFVGVLWLLIADSRTRSRRVFAVAPLLVLWANLHGSVVLGALLVALYGLLELVRQGRARPRPRRWALKGSLLIGVAPSAVLCSPYGFALVPYYRHLLINPDFGRLVIEWTPTTPRPLTALFYLLAFLAAWSIGRYGARLTRFEQLALLVTLLSALAAIRSIVWFGLTALVVLPFALDGARSGESRGAHPAARVGLALAAIAGLVAATAFALAQPRAWYVQRWPDRAAASVSEAARNPSARVFASPAYADWLLWREPQLFGRVAFDIRFELNSSAQIQRLADYFAQKGPSWAVAARGYDVVVIDPRRKDALRRSLLATGMQQSYHDRRVTVLVRRHAAPGAR